MLKKMLKKFHFSWVWGSVVLLLIGCAAGGPQTISGTPRSPEVQPLAEGAFTSKVKAFALILDASETMNEFMAPDIKFAIAKDIADRMVKTLPGDFSASATLRSFGHSLRQSAELTELQYDLKHFETGPFRESLGGIQYAGGTSPLALAIDATVEDLASAERPMAAVIISDGRQMNDAPAAAQRLKAAYGDDLCIHTIWVGQDPQGREVLEQITRIGGCGIAETTGALGSPRAMAQFVTQVFLDPATPAAVKTAPQPGDADGDGVTDDRDKCPETPKGARVSDQGCWIVGGPLFELDRDLIRPQYYSLLDDIIEIFRLNPDIRVEIQGHTCDIGRTDYNQKLSERRAQNVANYFMKHGVDYQRLTAVGYGETRPVAPNNSETNRMKNRRVELKIIK